MTDRELMQQALDALERLHRTGDTQVFDLCDAPALIPALRARLAEPRWVGLTDEEILADEVLRYHFGLHGGAGPVSKKGKAVIEAIEAKLKEKNT